MDVTTTCERKPMKITFVDFRLGNVSHEIEFNEMNCRYLDLHMTAAGRHDFNDIGTSSVIVIPML
jgi:hypothetical protein